MANEQKEEIQATATQMPTPTTFRVTPDTANAFRTFCTEHGMNQAQGLEHMLQVMELNSAKLVAPDRVTEIENFERLVKGIMDAYLNSLDLCKAAESRMLEKYRMDLTQQGKTIDQLQETIELQKTKLEQFAREKQEIQSQLALTQEQHNHLATTVTAAKSSLKEQLQINEMLRGQIDSLKQQQKEMEVLKQSNEDLKEQIQNQAVVLETQSERLQNEKHRADDAEANYDRADETIRTLEEKNVEYRIQISDLNRKIQEKEAEKENALKQAAMQAELDKVKAVMEKESAMQAELRKMDRENARLSVELERLKAENETGKA